MNIKITQLPQGLAKLVYNDGVNPEEDILENQLYDLISQENFKIKKVSPIFSNVFDLFKYKAEDNGIISNEATVNIKFPPLESPDIRDLIDEVVLIDKINAPEAEPLNLLALIPIENYFDRIFVFQNTQNGVLKRIPINSSSVFDVEDGEDVLLTNTSKLFFEPNLIYGSDDYDLFEFKRATDEIIFPEINKIKFEMKAYAIIEVDSISVNEENEITAKAIVTGKEYKSFKVQINVDIPDFLDDALNFIKINSEPDITTNGTTYLNETSNKYGNFEIVITGKIKSDNAAFGSIILTILEIDGGNIDLISPDQYSVPFIINYNKTF